MSSATILTLANGKGVDLLNVKASDIDFKALSEHLGKEKRFNGATPDEEYSVAQHLCIGTDAMLKAGATEEEAAYFLLHDAHEALWKDDPTPKKVAIAEHIGNRCGALSEDILKFLGEIEEGHNAAIHEAAGMRWPMPPEIKKLVKLYDVIMFVTEWRDLMRDIHHPNWAPYSSVQPLPDVIVPWSWAMSQIGWYSRAVKLLPALRRGGK